VPAHPAWRVAGRPCRPARREPPGRCPNGRGNPPPPPEHPAERFARTTFTASGEEWIATPKEGGGDRFVTIASADIIQQALNLGLVDELCISQVPVLFGTGIRYFGDLVGGHVMLEDPVVVQGTRALHLRYPVRR
jgi:hypothetical protein